MMRKFGRFQLSEGPDPELISTSGRHYTLLEGVSYPNPGYTSDIVFIMEYDTKPSGVLVGWLYGANSDNEYDICDVIEDYETYGKRLI